MTQRFILEVNPSADRLMVYDLDGTTLLDSRAFAEGGSLLDGLTARAGFTARHPTSAASPETVDFSRRPIVALAPVRNGRRKLWAIEHKYHCPIIGTCLGVEELRQLGKHYVWRTAGRPSDYEVHVTFVGAALERNALSLATHKLLEKKYAVTVRRFQQASTSADLRALWSEALASGQVQGAFWALMTHPKADQMLLATAYEDIHMLSHQIGAGQRADLERLTETRAELARLQKAFEQLRRRAHEQSVEQTAERRRLEALVREREQECARANASLAEVRARMAERADAVDTRTEEEETLRQRLAESERQALAWRDLWRSGQERIQHLEQAQQEKDSECQILERLLNQELGARCEECPNENCDARADLAGRLVLCVGGHKPLVEKYRQLVARCNGRFDHHDGGMEDNQRRLESMLASADAVVCAADFVSHDAYYRTKRFCKRFDKPHVLLGNSGISAFARALERVAS